MDSSDIPKLVTVVILLMLSAFFSSAETALTTINKLKVRSMIEEGNQRAITLSKVINNQGKMLSAILIGNNIVNLSASSLATTLAIKVLGNSGAGIATGILTLLILVFGEISPKTLATVYSEKLAFIYAPVVLFIMNMLTPVIFIINKLSLGFLFLLRVNPNAKTSVMTENELRTIVDVSHEEGVIEKEEKQMINNVVDFGDSQAKDVMIPRIDMTYVDVSATYDEIIKIFEENRFTRMPVCEDSADNVIGTINVKDLLLYKPGTEFNIKNYLREPYYTYEFKKTPELLREMRKSATNITIVVDEYGATVGLITLEDLLEEIVGDIRDEYDADEVDSIQKINDNEYIIEGSEKLDDIDEKLGLKLKSEDYDSIGGFVIGLLDSLPNEGDSVEYENLTFVVEKVEKNRIDKIHFYIKSKDEEVQDLDKEKDK